jgi:HEAT repeat protein
MAARGLSRLVHVEVEEQATVGLLLALFFLLAFGYVTGQAADYALFVQRFGARAMPLAILFMPVVGGALAFLNLRTGRRVGLVRLLVINVGAMIAVSLVIRVALAGEGHSWFRFGLPMWDAAVNNLNNLVVWSAATRLFDVRQAKRLGPVVSAGRSTALIAGGLLVPVMVAVVGTRNLFVVQAAAFALAGGVLLRLVRSRGPVLSAAVAGAERPQPEAERSARPYLLTVFATAFLSMVAYVLVRNIFLDRGAAQYPLASRYAAEIGLLNAAQGVLTLIGGLFLSGRLLRRFGLRGGLAALPLALVVVYVPFVALHLAVSGEFAIAAIGFVVGGALMYSVRTPSIQLLLQPLDGAQRTRAVSTVEGIVEPLALGSAAVILLAVTRLVHWGAVGMAGAVVVVAVGLAATGIAGFGRYRDALRAVVGRRWLRGGALDLTDGSTRDVLIEQARSGDLADVMGAVALLEEGGNDVGRLLVELVGHPDPEVRVFALDRSSTRSDPVPPHLLSAVLSSDPSSDVRAAAARLAGRAGCLDIARPALDGPDPACRRAAAIGLLEASDASDSSDASAASAATAARERLSAWVHSSDADDRRVAAAVLAAAGSRPDSDLLTILLDDADDDVRIGALAAVGRVGDPAHLPTVLSGFAHPSLRAASALAVESFRPHVLEPVEAAITASAGGAEARGMVRAVGRVADPAAAEVLVRLLGHRNASVRAGAATALIARDARLDPAVAEKEIRAEVAVAGHALGSLAAFGAVDSSAPDELGLVVDTLWDAVRAARDQVLRVLSLCHDPVALRAIRRVLADGDDRNRAYALESLDTTLPQTLKPWVLPLAALSGPADAVGGRLPRSVVTGSTVTRAQALTELIEGPDTWLAAVARHAVDPGACRETPRGETMIPTVERVLFLKGVDAFGGLPTDVLADVAGLLHEVVVPAGQTIVRKGEEGTSMFLVVEGRVRVHDDGQELNHLGRRSVFGELALLDAEPRSASVDSTEPSMLFRLDQEPFFELMTDRPEVLRQILRGVIATLRARLADVAELRSELDTLRASVSSPS